ncbi:MAG: hypothetical protein R2854_30005 [Caldilineaceae bacterium]
MVQNDVAVALSADTEHGGWVAAGSAPGQNAVFYRALGTDGSARGDVAAMPAPVLQSVASSADSPSSLVDLELDEPAGATSFADSSATGAMQPAATFAPRAA